MRLNTVLLAAALTAMSCATQAELLDNHVLVGGPYAGQGVEPGHDHTYSLRLGTGSWPFPYVSLYVDDAPGKLSFASIQGAPAYLTYIQNVNLVRVKAGDEISARTLSDGSLQTFYKISSINSPQGQVGSGQPITSATGDDTEVYLGFSYSDAAGQNPTYGWAHLRYTQAAGLSLVNSLMTTSDAGIFALTRTTIASSVDEASTAAMLTLGCAGIAALGAARQRRQRDQRPVTLA